MSERTYSDEEVAAIFAMAAEHQRQARNRSSATGLTLAEVEEAGREAGFDPESVRAAASELALGRGLSKRSKVAVAERWVEAPLEKGAWPDLVALLRSRYGASSAWWSGDTASLGTALEWRHTSASGATTTVTLSPRESRTLLRVVKEDSGVEDERRMGWLVAAFFGLLPAVLGGALVAETFGMGDFYGVLTVIVVLMASVGIGGPWLAGRVRDRRVRLADEAQVVADELVRQLDVAHEPPATDHLSETSGPKIDVPDEFTTSEHSVRAERQRQKG